MKRVSFFILAFAISARAEDTAFFEQKIRPVLIEHCYPCHSAEAKKLKGNLYLDSKAGWAKGGDSGEPAILPGKPDVSLLIRAVQHLEKDTEMPPKKPKLPDAIIADLVTWVKMGAPDPRDGKVEAKRGDKTWWSLQPVKPPTEVTASIDDFIGAALAAKGLTLNPPADPVSFIRRVTYDLTGLPPTPKEVADYVKAARGDTHATGQLIDRLLASPRYGERWGRHWLDVIRFGESNGFERNVVIDDLWPFRDFVIKSINDDKPFNQFITEHLAGDVVGRNDPWVEVGSAFLVAGPYDNVDNKDVVAQKNIRAATLDDLITATGSAFLGLSINCARCHDHKFDPIPTVDYYRLRSAFEGVTHGRRVIATKEQRAAFAVATQALLAEKNRLTAERDALDEAIEVRAKVAFAATTPSRPKIDVQGTDETFPPVEARHVRLVIHALTSDFQTKGKRAATSGAGRLTEFQIWSAESSPRNVALASNGSSAVGAKSSTAEDFPEAYGAQLTIDGQLGEQWFIGTPAELTITLAKPETISRITFINAKGGRDIDESKDRGATPCAYEVQVSLDGLAWKTVASDEGREPWTDAHGIARLRKGIVTAEETRQLDALETQIAQVQARLNNVAPLPQVWAGNYAQPTEQTFIQKGGDPTKPVQPVFPASLTVLDRVTKPYELMPDAPEGERRLALARWITSDDNPLTARVLANRLWQHHFGTGIVDTPSDFGFLGSKPTHPELLDYLATRLMAGGWKLKALHREILLSKTYQQSSAYREDAAKADKDARLLWRFPSRRLSAEEIRDTLLSVSGKLQLDPMGGPGFRLYKYTENNVATYLPLDRHGPETYRRAVYHQNARASIVDGLTDFDLPDNAFAAPKRANTTTPLQALTLLNHSFTQDMAAAFADRIAVTPNAIATAYQLAFQRNPTTTEHEAASHLIATHGLKAFCRAMLNANELIYLE